MSATMAMLMAVRSPDEVIALGGEPCPPKPMAIPSAPGKRGRCQPEIRRCDCGNPDCHVMYAVLPNQRQQHNRLLRLLADQRSHGVPLYAHSDTSDYERAKEAGNAVLTDNARRAHTLAMLFFQHACPAISRDKRVTRIDRQYAVVTFDNRLAYRVRLEE